MFCKYCGAKLIDGAAFCHECGKATYEQPVCPPPVPPVPPVQPVYQQPVPPVQPAYTYHVPSPVPTIPAQPAADPAQLEKLAQQTLTFGILGLCLSMLGVPGIVLSSIGGKNANTYKKLAGNLTGKALVGYRLAKAGKIISIIMTVILTLVVMALQSEVTYEYNDPFEYFSF